MAADHNLKLVLICSFLFAAFSQDAFEDCTGIPQCNANPCQDAVCPNHQDARCKIIVDNCGRCKAVFFNAAGDLSNDECFGGSSCQPCKPDPCTSASCPLLPEATCSSDTCKGCVAEFSLKGDVLTDTDCNLGSGPTLPCPDGTSRVRCENNPCDDASCPAEPGAECRPNFCGGCSAHFYIRNRRISDLLCLGIAPCPPDTPQAGCMQRPGERCLGQTCQAVPDAKCIIDGCGGCNVVFYKGGRRLTREDCEGCPSRNCDPCKSATCPDHPGARCEPRRCGQCKAVFYGTNREEIQSCCKIERCEDGSEKFHCKKDPCVGAACTAFPGATCKANTCGGCKAEFFTSNGNKLSDLDCVPFEYCPLDVPIAKCQGDNCLGETCPRYPGAQCKIDGCNGCKAIFYYGGKRLTSEDCNGCTNGNRVPGCRNPCDGTICASNPGARCEPQVCGECKARFFGLDRQEITTCGIGSCPGGVRFSCLIDPCRANKCPGVKDADCRANYCGGCKAEFYFKDSNQRIPDYMCEERESCPGDLPVAACIDSCEGGCPNYPKAECFIDGCNGCNKIYYDGKKRLTEEDCNGCPPGITHAKNCIDPCKNALCPLYPGARCEVRRCGTCKAVFFEPGYKEISNCCGGAEPPVDDCPGGQTRVECAVNPCDSAKCPKEPSSQCTANYCGECSAEFYLLGKRLSNAECGLCENGKEPINCGIVPQCFNPSCPAQPTAICRSTNCGECREWYEDEEGREIDCDVPICPGNKIYVSCSTPCIDSCEKQHDSCIEICDSKVNCICPNGLVEETSGSSNCVPKADCPAQSCPGNKIYVPCSVPCIDSCEEQHDSCIEICDPKVNCICPNGLVEETSGSSNCIPKADCPADQACPGNKVRVPCSIPCIDSCEIQHDSCIEICDSSINCVCPRGFVERTTGSNDCIPKKDCPGFCGNGKQPINCGIVPQCFQPSCPAHPTAICRSTNCGECREWYEDERGNKVDCRVASCPGNKIYVQCSKPCIDSCDVQHDACAAACDISINCVCPKGLVEETSGSNNCIPKENCPVPDPCPPGIPNSVCFADPCDVATCPGNSRAVCRPNYCGGCFAEFFVGARKLTDFDCVKNPDDCAAFTTCANNVCNCPTRPDAQCVVQYCSPNTCKPLYFDSAGKSLSYEECGLCDDGSEHVNCGIVPPCLVATCPAHPDAECRVSNCGVCRAYFVDDAGNTVDCERKVTCRVPETFAHGVFSPSGRSVVNVGEMVIYRCDSGFRMRGGSRRRCVERRGRGRLTGNPPRCFDKQCPRLVEGSSTCRSECDNNFECGFERICCWNGCAFTCVAKPSECPGGIPMTQCFANPCDFASCPRYPTATCRANYCGGCLQDWFVGNRKLQPDDCSEPSDPRCPPLALAIPLCIDLCTKDSDCNILEVCCFNGCGHRCMGY